MNKFCNYCGLKCESTACEECLKKVKNCKNLGHVWNYWGRDETLLSGKIRIIWKCENCNSRKHSEYKVLEESINSYDIPL